MKITPLALLTIFAATSSAFGLNGRAQSITKSNKGLGLVNKSPLVQPVDVQGNRVSSVVSTHIQYFSTNNYIRAGKEDGLSCASVIDDWNGYDDGGSCRRPYPSMVDLTCPPMQAASFSHP
jgi:hypothetical protein